MAAEAQTPLLVDSDALLALLVDSATRPILIDNLEHHIERGGELSATIASLGELSHFLATSGLVATPAEAARHIEQLLIELRSLECRLLIADEATLSRTLVLIARYGLGEPLARTLALLEQSGGGAVVSDQRQYDIIPGQQRRAIAERWEFY